MEKTELEEVVMRDAVWAYITRETIREHYGEREQAKYYGGIIADEVANTHLPVGDLRSCVRWASRLAYEAAMTDSEDGQAEILARRLLHSSTETALKAVGTQRRLAVHRADYRRRSRLLTAQSNRGLFQLEAKDLGLNGLDDLLQQVTLKTGKL